ncbi:hypothetical protein KIN20_000696 [Parelaphostrongylus tenuis]|uniref:Uncharacterized protein n=1 Tax=Parelaphostrongylus tenuis TaxID=148309 RepID=A0AAD5QFR6_PARTN|nr:hypothetical protein KIN20_000696 [Parelaphostrongylus tenuis]
MMELLELNNWYKIIDNLLMSAVAEIIVIIQNHIVEAPRNTQGASYLPQRSVKTEDQATAAIENHILEAPRNTQGPSHSPQRSIKTEGSGYSSHRGVEKPTVGPLTETKAVTVSSQVPVISEQSAQRATRTVPRRRPYPLRTITNESPHRQRSVVSKSTPNMKLH